MSDLGRRRALPFAALAFTFYAIHAAHHVIAGRPEHILWACHLAVLLVGLGFLLGSPTMNAIGLCWSLVGMPLWLLDLAGGGEFLPTSLFTHVGGLALSLLGIRTLGMPPNVWWKAALLLGALQLLSRAVTPAEANVNVAFHVWAGWEGLFPSYPRYLVSSYAILCGTFYAVERTAQRILGVGTASA